MVIDFQRWACKRGVRVMVEVLSEVFYPAGKAKVKDEDLHELYELLIEILIKMEKEGYEQEVVAKQNEQAAKSKLELKND